MRKALNIMFLALLLPLTPAVAQGGADHNFKAGKNIEVFNEIYKYLDMMYVDTLDADEVIGNGVNSMLQSLDPYTEYYPEERNKELRELYTGKFAGIGSLIRYNLKVGSVCIDEPYKDMPADKAGLKKGDIIVSIDDSVMTGKDVSYVSSHLRGDPGTTFMLKVKRPSTGKTMQVRITRQTIQNPPVPYYGMCDGDKGYLRLTSFTEDCSKDVRRAFIDMKNKGMKGLVLDLRGNGGGSEQEAVEIVNMFVPKGVNVVSNRGKLKRYNNDYKTTVEPIDTVMPVVVMVNGSTASASEITAGALQDLDRAIILGTRTYGKGLVQMTVDLPYNGNLKLTTSKYHIPSGRCIQAVNYKHAKGGYREHIPDSLTRVFHTANGREVRDGGGIKPDMEVKPDSLPNIVFYLASSGLDSTEVMHDYVVKYIAEHPTIAPAADFDLTDQEYEDFKQMVLKSGFTYDHESSKYLANLEKLAKFEGYYDDAKDDFESLKKKLTHDLARDLEYNKDDIKQMLASEILAAYYYQAGVTEYGLRYDTQMKEALKLLGDKSRYKALLTPKK